MPMTLEQPSPTLLWRCIFGIGVAAGACYGFQVGCAYDSALLTASKSADILQDSQGTMMLHTLVNILAVSALTHIARYLKEPVSEASAESSALDYEGAVAMRLATTTADAESAPNNLTTAFSDNHKHKSDNHNAKSPLENFIHFRGGLAVAVILCVMSIIVMQPLRA